MAGQSDYRLEERIENINRTIEMYNEAINNSYCLRLNDMAIGGRELIELGMKPGREIGDVLNKLFEMVLDDPEKNTKEILLKKAKEMLE